VDNIETILAAIALNFEIATVGTLDKQVLGIDPGDRKLGPVI
jgi:hypothetical protein